ncbi:MAG: hypothetical protein GXO69_11240 [Acidobacteria bacterium]|nr:hypothetical protein [Acidobacteriota bacterium]
MADTIRKSGNFRALLHLNFILAWRAPKTEKISNILGTLLFFGSFLIMAVLFFGIGLGLSLQLHSPSKQVQFLTWESGILLFIFTLLSVFTKGLNQGNDPTPLFHTPVSTTRILLAEFIARIAGPTVLPPLGLFAGSILGMVYKGYTLTAILCLAGMILWIFQVFLLLTALDYLIFNLQRSRHFKDLVRLISGLLVGIWLTLQFWIYSKKKIDDTYFKILFLKLKAVWPSVEHVAFFFPGLSPVAWATGKGNSLLILAAAIIEIFLILKLGSHSLRQLVENGSGTSRRKRKKHRLKTKGKNIITSRLPFWPFAAKEARYLARDPRLKMMLLNVLAGPLSILILFSTPKSGFSIRAIEYGVPFLFLMYMGPFIFNSLAIERDGLRTVLLSPFPRWKLFAGKNFAYFVLYLLLLVPVSVILSLKGVKAPSLAADWACFLPMAPIFFGVGNLISLFMPIPIIAAGKRLRANLPKGRQWLFSLVRLLINGVLLLISAPLFIGRFVIIHFWQQPWIILPVVLLMTVYGTVSYYFMLAAANRMLPAKEPRIYELLVRKGG